MYNKQHVIYISIILFYQIIHFSCDFGNTEYPVEKRIYEIHTINSDGGNDMFLSHGSSPEFSLDDTKIIYTTRDPNESINVCIMKMRLDGSDQICIVDYYPYLSDLDGSPTKKQLLFRANDFSNQSSDIFIVNEDGSQLKNLTNTVDKTEFHPAFSADGNWIIYMQSDTYNGFTSLILSDLNGNTKILKTSKSSYLDFPRFTLNDMKVIYSEQELYGDGTKLVKIFDIANPETDEVLEHVQPTTLVTAGGKIVYNSRFEVHGYDLYQEEETYITDGFAIEVSNDGQEILYLEDDMHKSSLLKINYGGTDLITLVVDDKEYSAKENFEYSADFSKDKSTIVYEKQYSIYEYLD
jgi:Tol biopolymer transport system component